MKKLYLGILFVTSFLYVATSRVKRFSGKDQRFEWNWNRNDHLPDAQTKTSSQANWPSKGSSGASSTKGRGDSNPNRDGTWAPDSWTQAPVEIPSDGYDMGWNTEPQGNNKGSAYPDGDGAGGEGGGNLETILGGVPGMDFPNFVAVPRTDFDCSSMPSRGYYGDVEAGCQVFHICQPGNRKDSFLCPVGTIFNQKYFVCDWWFNVNCSDTPSYYDLNNDIYKEAAPVTEEVPVTTEKILPWNSQDLDRKRPTPTKSWGNPPSTGKQNTRWKDTPIRRGSKSSEAVSTSSNSWSHSDVQKEITVSWGGSTGSTAGTFGSSTSSSSFIPTTKPIWYGIDGLPAKDQSNGMSKRTGLVQTPLPFGTRMRKSTAVSAANTWASTEAYQPTSRNSNNYDVSTTNAWNSDTYSPSTANAWKKNTDTYSPSTTRGWLKVGNDADASNLVNRNKWNNDINDYPTTNARLKIEDIPETSINPTGIKGVWEQETTKRSDQNGQTDTNVVGKGFVTKSSRSVQNGRNFRAVSSHKNEWGQRQTGRNRQSSKVTNAGWVKNNFDNQNAFTNANDISRRKSWK